MNGKKQLCSLARTLLPSVGFTLTCTGIYLVSLQTVNEYTLRVIPVYVMISCGILVMVIGVFWGICHSMKSKMYQRRGHERHIQVFTIQRSSFFPPSYEESQASEVCSDTSPEMMVIPERMDMVMSLAPPLYNQNSSESPDCRWSWEQPPPYSQVECIQQGQRCGGGALSGH